MTKDNPPDGVDPKKLGSEPHVQNHSLGGTERKQKVFARSSSILPATAIQTSSFKYTAGDFASPDDNCRIFQIKHTAGDFGGPDDSCSWMSSPKDFTLVADLIIFGWRNRDGRDRWQEGRSFRRERTLLRDARKVSSQCFCDRSDAAYDGRSIKLCRLLQLSSPPFSIARQLVFDVISLARLHIGKSNRSGSRARRDGTTEIPNSKSIGLEGGIAYRGRCVCV